LLYSAMCTDFKRLAWLKFPLFINNTIVYPRFYLIQANTGVFKRPLIFVFTTIIYTLVSIKEK
ncbi:MAG: hypothetical protein WCH21_00680, partial [Bacteroidota bacterium]